MSSAPATGNPQGGSPADTPGTPPPLRETSPARAEAEEVLYQLTDLYAQWAQADADIAARLRPGVSDAELDAAEAALGARLPPGARAWFGAVDGVEPVRSRYRTWQPTVGPGGWVPLSLAAAVRRVQECSPADFGRHLPLFTRDEQFLAVRLDGTETVVDQLLLEEPTPDFSTGWSVHLTTLLEAWANALVASVIWLPDARDWVVDPFSARAVRNRHLLE